MNNSVKEYRGLVDETLYKRFEYQNGSEMYVHATYSCRMEDLIAFSTILYPTFVEIDGYIFIKPFLEGHDLDDTRWLEELERDCNFDRRKVEMWVNSWSIGEFFIGSGNAKAMDDERLIREFCKILEFSWKARAKEIFPNKEFVFETGYELMGELGFAVAFYQKNY